MDIVSVEYIINIMAEYDLAEKYFEPPLKSGLIKARSVGPVPLPLYMVECNKLAMYWWLRVMQDFMFEQTDLYLPIQWIDCVSIIVSKSVS